MNDGPVIIETVRGQDRKRYPTGLPLSPGEKARARVLAHSLVCRDGLSYRDALETMRSYGVRRSLGWLVKIIRGFDCEQACKGSPAEPEPQPEPQERPAASVHQQPGGMTGMVDRG